MPDWDLKALGLDSEVIEPAAIATEGEGQAYLAAESSDRLLGGSCLALAGSYWALLERQDDARRCFVAAADAYRAQGSSYWIVLATCAGSHERLIEGLSDGLDQARDDLSATERTYDMLGAAAIMLRSNEPRWREAFGRSAEHLGRMSRPVGRMSLPSNLYASLLGSVAEIARGGTGTEIGPRFQTAVNTFFGRVGETTEAAMVDRYHWSRLLTTVQPLELEALAVGIVSAAAWRRAADRRVSESVELPPRHALTLLVSESLASSMLA